MDRDKTLALARECGASVTTVQEGQFFQFRDDELAEFAARIEALALEKCINLGRTIIADISAMPSWDRPEPDDAVGDLVDAIRALNPKQQEK